MKQNKLIAITGGIGSGKTTVCKILREKGYNVISCDNYTEKAYFLGRSKRFLSKHEILFRLSTFDPLYFRGFLNSWWQIGYAYDICDKITSGILLDVMYADQFTLSGMISGFQGKLFVVYKF